MGSPVIIGAGLAGLTAALALSPRPVYLLGRPFDHRLTSSELAQGGIAACVGADDGVDGHVADTLAAGAGLCDGEAVRSIIAEAPLAIQNLLAKGVPFDRDAEGKLLLGLEGAHSRRRIAHVGDGTGAAMMRVLWDRVRETPSIRVMTGVLAVEILRDDHGVSGLVALDSHMGRKITIPTRQVVLATGSACALWRETTVPLTSWGHGLVLAARVGARLRDMEFVQFHPTALDAGEDPMPLISEAVRGEGAALVLSDGQAIVDPLAPRDIVARAIEKERSAGRSVFLDARGIKDFARRFSTIRQTCEKAGLDPACDLLPVRPVAHYHMGGVATDKDGRTNRAGLWACGEVACTGLHGANRLASNSLLEAVVMGARVAQAMPSTDDVCGIEEGGSFALPSDPMDVATLRALMSDHVGLLRDADGLAKVVAAITPLAPDSDRALVALMVARAALERRESRGAHARVDYPDLLAAEGQSLAVTYSSNQVKVGVFS